MAGSKFAIWELIRDHYGTFVDARDSSRHVPDFVFSLVVPLIAAGVVALVNFRLGGLSAMLTGAATLTGILFGFATWTFGLRVSLMSEEKVTTQSSAAKRLAELFYNACYSILAALVALITIIAAVTTQDGVHANRWWSAVVTFVVLHLIFTLSMCLKRIHAAFDSVTR